MIMANNFFKITLILKDKNFKYLNRINKKKHTYVHCMETAAHQRHDIGRAARERERQITVKETTNKQQLISQKQK